MSVANLDAGPVPNPPIPIPNGGASRPVACWLNVDRSGRYIDGSWAGYRRSKQCTNCQAPNNASGYLTTPSSRSPGCACKASIIVMCLCKTSLTTAVGYSQPANLANDNRIVRVNRSLSLIAIAPCAMSLALSSILRSFAGFVHHHGPAIFFYLGARRTVSEWPF